MNEIFSKFDEISLNGETRPNGHKAGRVDDRAVFIYGDESMGTHETKDREFWKDLLDRLLVGHRAIPLTTSL